MNSILETMLSKYNPKNNIDRENAIKEIVQEVVLAGLSRGGFFNKAAFYGGTCLRIFHGLNRFSEDLDFTLINKESFNIEDYIPYVKKELLSCGLDMDVSFKDKNKDKEIQTAFVKGNTLLLMMNFFPSSNESKQVVGNQKIKIKLEIDTDNPSGGTTEIKYQLLPSPYEIRIFDENTLFAGKIHAIICRNYKNHVKGRDYYDYLFYLGKGTKVNLKYLENKLKKTGKISIDTVLTLDMVKDLLKERFLNVDFNSAKEDVSNFISDKDSLKLWSSDLFISTLSMIS